MNQILILTLIFLVLLILVPRINKALFQAKPGGVLSPSPTPTPPLTTSSSINISRFTYPHAKILSANSNTLNLESNANTAVITDWYKQQIKNSGMNTTSFIQTNTNGEVLNQLVGAKAEEKIKVSISTTASSQITKIEINLQ